MSLTSPYVDRTVRSTSSDTSEGEVGNSHFSRCHSNCTSPYNWYFAIGMSIFNLPSDRLEHILHSFIVPKLYIHLLFRSVILHHCCFLIIKTQLSVKPFMNLISRNARALEVKSTYDRILPFSRFECPYLKLTNKTHTRNLTLYSYKTQFYSQSLSPLLRWHTTLPFCVSNATYWENVCRFSKQAWNSGTLYERDDQLARGVVICAYYDGLQNQSSHPFFQPVCMYTRTGNRNDRLEW
jgi:hypothetical protein